MTQKKTATKKPKLKKANKAQLVRNDRHAEKMKKHGISRYPVWCPDSRIDELRKTAKDMCAAVMVKKDESKV